MTPGFYQYEFFWEPLMMSVQNTDNCSEVLPCTCVQTIAMAMMARRWQGEAGGGAARSRKS
jgi:hypothetical protein